MKSLKQVKCSNCKKERLYVISKINYNKLTKYRVICNSCQKIDIVYLPKDKLN